MSDHYDTTNQVYRIDLQFKPDVQPFVLFWDGEEWQIKEQS